MEDRVDTPGQTVIPAAIAKALVALQAEVKSIEKTAENGHFKNTYAPLDAVMDYALPLLSKHKLALSQWPITFADRHYLRSILTHESGENMQSDLELLLTKSDPQGLGSALTYEKRQTVMAILGISAKDEDDDAEYSRRGAAVKQVPKQQPATDEQKVRIKKLATQAGYDYAWQDDVLGKATTHKAAQAIIQKLETKVAEAEADVPVLQEQIAQIKKLAKEAGSGDDWVAHAVMSVNTAKEANEVIAKLDKQLRTEPTERVWK